MPADGQSAILGVISKLFSNPTSFILILHNLTTTSIHAKIILVLGTDQYVNQAEKMYCSSKVAKNFLKIEKFNKNFDSQKENNESNLKGIGNNGSHRRMSALELAILPRIMHDTKLPVSQRENSESEQLTIFYAGIVHVYDNLPAEKAQSIMDLARESSLLYGSTNVKFPPKEAEPTQKSQIPSACKFQAELPIARRKSLKRFFEKRHNRIISKQPYASPVSTQHEDECDHNQS